MSCEARRGAAKRWFRLGKVGSLLSRARAYRATDGWRVTILVVRRNLGRSRRVDNTSSSSRFFVYIRRLEVGGDFDVM